MRSVYLFLAVVACSLILWTCRVRLSESSSVAETGNSTGTIVIDCQTLYGTIDITSLKITLAKPGEKDFKIEGYATRSLFTNNFNTYSLIFNQGPDLASLSMYSFRVKDNKATAAAIFNSSPDGKGRVDFKCKG